MNVNLLQPSNAWPHDTNLWGQVQDSEDILNRSADVQTTGDVALIPDPKALMGGVFQVWFKTDEGVWLWVDPDGIMHKFSCPISHSESVRRTGKGPASCCS